jgi:predicted RNase H-like HicB family nuclease
MSAKSEALRLIADLPEDTPWSEVVRAVSEAAPRGGRPMMIREYRAPYGAPAPETETDSGGEAGMSHDFDVLIERDQEGVYVASVPALGGCHTQAGSVEQALERVREAIALCLEVAEGRPAGTGYVGVRRVSVPA